MEEKRSAGGEAGERPRARRKSFTEALREKYCGEDDGFELTLNELVIDIVVRGIPARCGSNAELGYLKNVVLSHYSVGHAGLPDDGLISLCPNVVDLDLSSNLLDSWSEVLPILSQLPNLQFVNLSQNNLKNKESYLENWDITLENVGNLVLNSTYISWSDVVVLCQHLPSLKELHSCDNGYTELAHSGLNNLQFVESLWLNNNKIKSWSEIWKLCTLKNLKSLVLSGNPIEDVFYHDFEAAEDKWPDTTTDAEFTTGLTNTPDSNDFYNSSQDNNNDDLSQGGFQEGITLTVWDDSNRQQNSGSRNNKTLSSTNKRLSLNDSTAEEVRLNKINLHTNPNANILQCFQLYGSDRHTESNENRSFMFDNSECPCCVKMSDCFENFTHQNKCHCHQPFRSLQTLCLSQTKVCDWKHIWDLNKFPSLQSVRVMGVPFLSDLPAEERRKLFIASLPKIYYLNGSEITATERDKAERHFLRFLADRPNKPVWFSILENKHGKLRPLADIDLGAGFQEWAYMSFVYNGVTFFQNKIHVIQPVEKLRIQISKQFGLSLRSFQMFHYPCNPAHGETCPELEELRLDSLPMSRFDFLDGDEIHIYDCS